MVAVRLGRRRTCESAGRRFRYAFVGDARIGFVSNRLDLTPGLESLLQLPGGIWQAATWWYDYYSDRNDGARIVGAFSAKHDLVPDSRYGSPPEVHVAR